MNYLYVDGYVYKDESPENLYMTLLNLVLQSGIEKDDRTGVGTRSFYDAKIVLDENSFPFVTTRSVPLRLAFEEMWFFLRGETDTKKLEEKGCYFWKGNTTREFLDKRGLEYLNEGELGSAYSTQWRASGGYDEMSSKLTGKSSALYSGKDQLLYILDLLDNDKTSRRIYTTLWNAKENNYGCLTPCWHSMQLVVHDNKLNMKLMNRSLDIAFGYNFAVMQYRLFQLVLARMFDLEVGTLSIDLNDIHIYNNQIEWVKELLHREIPTQEREIDRHLIEVPKVNNLYSLLDLEWEDFKIKEFNVNKDKFKTPRPTMAA